MDDTKDNALCDIEQFSDTMVCAKCGQSWDAGGEWPKCPLSTLPVDGVDLDFFPGRDESPPSWYIVVIGVVFGIAAGAAAWIGWNALSGLVSIGRMIGGAL